MKRTIVQRIEEATRTLRELKDEVFFCVQRKNDYHPDGWEAPVAKFDIRDGKPSIFLCQQDVTYEEWQRMMAWGTRLFEEHQ